MNKFNTETGIKDGKLVDTYVPHPKQVLFHKTCANEVLFGGAAGPGKSRALRAEGLRWACTIPGLQIYLFRRTFPELEKNHIISSQGEFPKDLGEYKSQARRWEFFNGSMLHFCHCQYEQDVFQYQGAEIHLLLIDELTTFCVTDEAEVLTSDGWKNIKDCRVGESVMSLSESGMCEFKVVQDCYNFNYTGDIIYSNSRNGINFDVTPNHRMVIVRQYEIKKGGKKWEFCEAKDLPKDCFFPRTGKWVGNNNIKTIVLKEHNGRGLGKNQNAGGMDISINDWCEFLGWYISEGSAFEGKKHKTPIVDIAQYTEPPELKSLLDRLPWKYRRHERGYRIFSRQLFEMVKDIGNSHTKRIPRELLNLSIEPLKHFLDAYLMGDGHKTKHGSYLASSASDGLIDDLQEVCVRIGLISTITKNVKITTLLPNGNKHSGFIHRISISRPQRKISEVYQGRGQIKTRQHNGKVYCLKVADNGTFLARTRGKIWWSGNSKFQYDYLRGRVRCTLPVPEEFKHKIPGIYCASNPGGVGHTFCRARWVDYARPMEIKRAPVLEGGMLRQYIPALLEDNPTLTLTDPGYRSRLEALPEPYRTAYLKGDWDIFIGQAFDFYYDYHVIKDHPIPAGAPVYMTFDWGFGAPFSVCWFYIDQDGRMIMFSEWYGWDGNQNKGLRLTDIEVADGINTREQAMGILNVVQRIAGPDCFQKKPDYRGGGQGPSTAEIFSNRNLFLTAGDANRKLKIRQFRNRLMVPRDEKGEVCGRPMLQVFESCIQFIRTIPAISALPSNPEDIDTTGEDHVFDSVCLLAMARPVNFDDTKLVLKPLSTVIIDALEKKQPDEELGNYVASEMDAFEKAMGYGQRDMGLIYDRVP